MDLLTLFVKGISLWEISERISDLHGLPGLDLKFQKWKYQVCAAEIVDESSECLHLDGVSQRYGSAIIQSCPGEHDLAFPLREPAL